MTMPCRITDENIYNPWEDDHSQWVDEFKEPVLKGLGNVTINDLMAIDTYPWVGKNREFGYILELESDESTEPFLQEAYLHPAAMESLATFCRRFVNLYDKISQD